MQNEPNFQKTKMNVTSAEISYYENNWLLECPKNEPKRTQSAKRPKMNTTYVLTGNYSNERRTMNNELSSKRTQFQIVFA